MKLVSLFIAFCISSLPLAVNSSGQRAAAFNPSGYFLPVETEGKSSGIRWIMLSDFHGKGQAGPLYVELRAGNWSRWTTFSQAKLTLEGSNLQFVTKHRNERWYEFTGKFSPTDLELSNGGFTDAHDAPPIALRGVLRCFRAGTLVRSVELAFIFTAGD